MAEQSTPTADPTQPGAAAPGGESGAPSTTTPPFSGSPNAISMSREELDRQLAEARRAGERTAKDTDEIKQLRAAAKRLQEIEEASKSETEKLTERAAKAEAERERISGQFRTALIRSEFTRLAADKRLTAQQIQDAFTLATLTGVEVTDDGTVKGADAALEAVLKDRPYLAEPPVTAQPNGAKPAAPNINPGGQAAPAMTREQRIAQATEELARRHGRDF